MKKTLSLALSFLIAAWVPAQAGLGDGPVSVSKSNKVIAPLSACVGSQPCTLATGELFKVNGGSASFSGAASFADKVGVGTTNPGEPLQVNGGIKTTGAGAAFLASSGLFDFNAGYTRLISMGANASTLGGFDLLQSGSDGTGITSVFKFYSDKTLDIQGGNVRVSASGAVGIGVTNPNNVLYIGSPTGYYTSGTASTYQFGMGASGNTKFAIGHDLNMVEMATLGGAYPIRFKTNNTDALWLGGDQKVGIGTTDPKAKLDTNGTIRSVGSASPTGGSGIEMLWDGTYGYLRPYNRDGSAYLPMVLDGNPLYMNNSTTANAFLVTGGGRVGVATTNPGYTMDVNGAFNASEVRVNGAVLSPGTGSNWTVSGSDIYRAAGKVGIGVTAPAATLDVAATSPYFALTALSGVNGTYTQYTNTGGNLFIGEDSSTGGGLLTGSLPYSAVINHSGNYPFHIGTNNMVRVTVAAGGAVGVGTTDATHGRLNVEAGTSERGIYAVAGSGKEAAYLVGGCKTSACNALAVHDSDGAQKFAVRGDGNVGIGTTNPGDALEVNGAFRLPDSAGAINWGGTNTQILGYGTAKTLRFITNGAEDMRVSQGNVGIGTTNPNTILHVKTATDANLHVYSDGVGVGVYANVDAANAYSPLSLNGSVLNINGTSAGDVRLAVGGGKVGIGTTAPDAKLHIVDTATSTNTVITGWSGLRSNHAASANDGSLQVGGSAIGATLQATGEGNTIVALDSQYDNAAATMKFRMRTAGDTPVEAMKITGAGAVYVGASAGTLLYYCNGGTAEGTVCRGNSNACATTCTGGGGTMVSEGIYVP